MTSHFDVVVAGGGPAGFGASIAAARMGVSVALVERHDVLGGMGTAALVNNFCPAHLDGKRLIIGGIFAELRQRLIKRNAIFASHNHAYDMECYNPEVFAEEASSMCREAGVALFLKRKVFKIKFLDGAPTEINLDDGTAFTGRTVVDATGDATIAAQAGVKFMFGNNKSHSVMPLTFCYKIGPIDLEAVRRSNPAWVTKDSVTGHPRLSISGAHQQVALARQRGELTIPRDHVSGVANIPGEPQNATVNFGRVFVKDPTNPVELAWAEVEGRKQIEEGIRFFRRYLPGFEKIELISVARQIGVRESRQIIGLYTLTENDVLSCRQFEDVIAQCCYAIDVHDPHSIATRLVELKRGTHYDIPWRCLIPKEGPKNLIVAGRSISATQEAMSSFRVSPSVMAIGEAAGVTAALAAKNGASLPKVSPTDVQARLRAAGGILE